MAIVPFQHIDTLIEGVILRAGPLTTGDETNELTVNEGNAELTVHVHGTVAGATVAIQGSIVGVVFATVDDVYGDQMSYTVLPQIKSIGPALNEVKGVVSGGAGTSVFIDIYKVMKVR